MLQLSRSSLFVKLLAAFFIVIIPFYLIALLINNKGASSITEQVSKSVSDRMHFYVASLEREVDRISEMQLDYVTDQQLLYLSGFSEGMTDFERNQAVLHVQERMLRMKASSLYIDEVSVYIPLINRTVRTHDLETSIDSAQFKALQVENRITSSPFIYWEDRLFLPLQHPIIGGETPLFLLATELSRHELLTTLDSIVSQMGGEAFLLNGEQQWHIGASEPPAFMQALYDRINADKSNASSPLRTTIKLDKEKYFLTLEYSNKLGLSLAVIIPEKQMLGSIKAYNVWLWLITGFALIVVIGFSYWIYKVLHKPLAKMMRAMRQVETGNFQVVAQPSSHDEFGYLFRKFNEMVGKLDVLVNEVYEQNIRTQRAELKRLQSQINPHFLYNSFFILTRMIKSYDNDTAYAFSIYLGEYFQFITRDGQETVSLSQELKHARTYIDIQTMCFSGRIVADISDIPQQVVQLEVPRLIIQPIVENAYKYALEEKLSAGRVKIHFRLEQQLLHIVIEDNGELEETALLSLQQKLEESDIRNHTGNNAALEETTGLINVHRRIRLRYGASCGLQVERGDMGGLKATITVATDR
jgi:two-component system sensor histidine kinase YesM